MLNNDNVRNKVDYGVKYDTFGLRIYVFFFFRMMQFQLHLANM